MLYATSRRTVLNFSMTYISHELLLRVLLWYFDTVCMAVYTWISDVSYLHLQLI